jgi:hypothetical protein
MATIQLNAPSVNKTTKAYVEGNGRRKFLATIVKTDPSNIVPAFADNVQKSVSVWIPLQANMADGTAFNPADQLTALIGKVKEAGKGQRVQLNGVIRNFVMDEPTKGENDIVYQNLTVTLDDSAEKSVMVVAPAPWNFADANL